MSFINDASPPAIQRRSGNWGLGQQSLTGSSGSGGGAGTYSWTLRGPAFSGRAVACSADGSRVIVAHSDAPLSISSDYGITWNSVDVTRFWLDVASSSTGVKLVAVVSGGLIYTSSDSGANWIPRDSVRAWFSCCSSTDGTNLVATAGAEFIYTSADSGSTWSPKNINTRTWKEVACSSSGSHILAACQTGKAMVSADFGANWSDCTITGNPLTFGAAVSGDGSKMVLTPSTGTECYVSTDSGTSWSAKPIGAIGNGGEAACTPNFTTIFMNCYRGDGVPGLINSTDSGANFATLAQAPIGFFDGMAISDDGVHVYTCDRSSGILCGILTIT